jgi:hypothetical protein
VAGPRQERSPGSGIPQRKLASDVTDNLRVRAAGCNDLGTRFDAHRRLVFCRVKSWLTERRFVSLPFADHCEPLVNSSAELDDLLLRAREYVDSGKWKYVKIRTTASWPGHQSELSKNAIYSLHRLDLRRNAQELFRSFHRDCVQRKIRRAERERLRYEEGTSEGLLQKFYELLLITRRRQGLPSQPLSWFREVITAFGNDLKIRLAAKNDMPVASILMLTHKKSMVYKYGCSDARFHKWGACLSCSGTPYWTPKKGDVMNLKWGSDSNRLGLISFKKRWGTVRTELSCWTHPNRPELNLSERQMAILRCAVPYTYFRPENRRKTLLPARRLIQKPL